MTQEKYQDMSVQQRAQRPAECFEPGYDTVFFKSEEAMKCEQQTLQKMTHDEMRKVDPVLKMSYTEARAQAFQDEWKPAPKDIAACKPIYLAHK